MKSLVIGGSSNLGSHLINTNPKKFDFTYFKNKKKKWNIF